MSNTKRENHYILSTWQFCFLITMVTLLVILPDVVYAANTPFGKVFCTAQSWFTGNTGKGLATIGVAVVGLGALLGKVSWGMALIVGTGVAIVFGAVGIVDAINAGAPSGCDLTGFSAP